jgi:hypothetical protein
LQFYTKAEASYRSGYFSKLVCIPVTSAFAGTTSVIECYTCDKVSTLLQKIQRRFPGCTPAEDFCLKVKSTKGVVTYFLDQSAFIGAYNLKYGKMAAIRFSFRFSSSFFFFFIFHFLIFFRFIDFAIPCAHSLAC